MTENVEILARKKGSQLPWKPTSWPCLSMDDAKDQIRGRSDFLDAGLDFAIRRTTVEEFSERN